MGFFSKGLKNEFETAVVNEPSVFEPLKFYCIYIFFRFCQQFPSLFIILRAMLTVTNICTFLYQVFFQETDGAQSNVMKTRSGVICFVENVEILIQ